MASVSVIPWALLIWFCVLCSYGVLDPSGSFNPSSLSSVRSPWGDSFMGIGGGGGGGVVATKPDNMSSSPRIHWVQEKTDSLCDICVPTHTQANTQSNNNANNNKKRVCSNILHIPYLRGMVLSFPRCSRRDLNYMMKLLSARSHASSSQWNRRCALPGLCLPHQRMSRSLEWMTPNPFSVSGICFSSL